MIKNIAIHVIGYASLFMIIGVPILIVFGVIDSEGGKLIFRF